MANNNFYGYTPKMTKSSGKEGTIYSGAEKGTTYEHLGNKLDRLNPYEFRKGMDYELTAIGCMRLAESTPEEREKATEKVIKNLEEHGGYYTALITYETNFRNTEKKPSFKAWLKEQDEEYNMKEVDQKFKNDKMTEPKVKSQEVSTKADIKMKTLKETIKKEISLILKEQSAKQAAMADMEDDEGAPKKGKGKGKAKKDKPVRKDRFDKEEEAIKDILFRLDANGKKPKEEGDYTKDEPAPGSMLAVKDEMLEKYKELKSEEEDPKKTLEEYNKLLTEKNEEFKESIEKFVEEFEGNGISMDIFGEKLSDTIKNLQQRLKDGLNKARAGVEEEARGMRRQVAETQMTREEALRLLEICKENGISLREGTDGVRVYYEIAKAAYLEGVANALKL